MKSTQSNTTQPRERSTPQRTCVACRESFAQTQLLRLVCAPQGEQLHLDYLQKLPGRGAYVCATSNCIERAIKRGGFQRAFKKKVSIEVATLHAEAYKAALRQIRSLLSLAKRANFIAAGHSQVVHALQKGEGHLILLAHDASPNIRHRMETWSQRLELPLHTVLTKKELGPAVGCPESALILIMDQGFAAKIERETKRASQLVPAEVLPPANADQATSTTG